MELRLLGPLELIVDGRPVDLGGLRQRVVLSQLALNANRITPVERLIDAVWAAAPPPTARSQIQICISGLRRLIPSEDSSQLIVTQKPGYLLRTPDQALDTTQFASLVASARAHANEGYLAEAVEQLESAIALWRGSALADVRSDLVQRSAELLEERRRAAVEERLRLQLALGRHEEITGELRALVEEEPLRERIHGFLMIALHRSGRQAEALEVARRARSIIVEELGIEPGQELQSLEQAILRGDPSLEAPKVPNDSPLPSDQLPVLDRYAVPWQLPPSIADFTGREDQIAQITRTLQSGDVPATAPYAMRIVAISGRDGVGKSSLAVRVAHELRDEFPDGQLYADLRDTSINGEISSILGRFLRALGVSGSAIPEDPHEQTQLYRSRLAHKRVLVLLDNVANEKQISALLPGSPSCAVLTTSRARLSGLAGAHLVDIDAFDTEQSLEMLAKIVGQKRIDAELDASIELANLCSGLPLTLRIAGARLASRPHWRVLTLTQRLADDALRLDELAHGGLELRAHIDLIYQSLSEEEQRLLRLCALVNVPQFPGWVASALLGVGLRHAEKVLESLVDARVLDTVVYPDDPTRRYNLHDLLCVRARECLLESETDAEKNATLARFLGAWLSLAETAHRKEYGGYYTLLRGSAQRWHPAAPDVDLIGDPMTWWENEYEGLIAAIHLAATSGFDELCWNLAMTTVTFFETKGHFEDWLQTSQMAYEAAERAGNRRGQAAMLYSLGCLRMCQKRLDDAERSFMVALELFDSEGDAHGRALVLRNSAFVERLRGHTSAMLEKYNEALEILRSVGDRVAEAHVLCSIAKHRIDEGEYRSAHELLDDSLRICQETGCLRVESQVLYRFADMYRHVGNLELAHQTLNRALRIVRDKGDRIGEVYVLHLLGLLRRQEGKLDNAYTTLANALELAQSIGERWLEGHSRYTLGEIALAQGNNAVGATHLNEARQLFEELRTTVWQAKTLTLLSEVHVSNGDDELARTEREHALLLLGSDHRDPPAHIDDQHGPARSRQHASPLRNGSGAESSPAFSPEKRV